MTPGGDAAWGAHLAGECVACHRADGADDGIPAITGWAEADFRRALQAYRARTRPDPTMQLIAGTLSDAEIAALAAWFGAQ